MAKKQIFLSFHFDNDVMRVQQIRNIGVLEGNEGFPLSATITNTAETKATHQALQEVLFDAIR
jgi:hypothetical protein